MYIAMAILTGKWGNMLAWWNWMLLHTKGVRQIWRGKATGEAFEQHLTSTSMPANGMSARTRERERERTRAAAPFAACVSLMSMGRRSCVLG